MTTTTGLENTHTQFVSLQRHSQLYKICWNQLCDRNGAWERSKNTACFFISVHLVYHCGKQVWSSDCWLWTFIKKVVWMQSPIQTLERYGRGFQTLHVSYTERWRIQPKTGFDLKRNLDEDILRNLQNRPPGSEPPTVVRCRRKSSCHLRHTLQWNDKILTHIYKFLFPWHNYNNMCWKIKRTSLATLFLPHYIMPSHLLFALMHGCSHVLLERLRLHACATCCVCVLCCDDGAS